MAMDVTIYIDTITIKVNNALSISNNCMWCDAMEQLVFEKC